MFFYYFRRFYGNSLPDVNHDASQKENFFHDPLFPRRNLSGDLSPSFNEENCPDMFTKQNKLLSIFKNNLLKLIRRDIKMPVKTKVC